VLAKPLTHSRSLVEELGMLLSRTRRLVWINATRRLEQLGESMLAWQLLAHLVRGGKSTQTELAVAISQHPAGVSRLLDELEKRGDVLRSRDPRDRRKIHVGVTSRGRRRFETALPEVARAAEQAFEPLSDIERRLLRDLLRKVGPQEADCRGEPKSHR